MEVSDSFPNTRYLDLGTSSYELSGFIEVNTNKIVLIDCLNIESGKAGQVFKLSIGDILSDSEYRLSLHQIKLIDSLNLISIDHELPEVMILGIVPHDIKTVSTSLSDILQDHYDQIFEKVKEYISDFIE